MKLKWLGAILVLTMGLLITSCSKDDEFNRELHKEEIELTETNIGNNLVNRSTANELGLDLECFTILYPFQLVDIEGVEYLIESDDSFETVLTEDTEIIDFVYPLDILNEDGTSATVTDALELGDLFSLCVPNGGWDEDNFPAYLIDPINSCYSVVYPISLEDTDGNVVVANDEEEFIEMVSQDLLFFVFPFDLVDTDGNTVTVGDVDGLFTALIDCNGFEQDSIWDWENGFEYIGCFTVEFPLTLVLTDGSTVVVNNHMEYCDLMLEGSIADFAYPLTLIDEDGNELVVNSSEELTELLEDCWDGPFGGEDVYILAEGELGGCYTINFPITGVQVDDQGNTSDIVINNLDEIINGQFYISSIDYPITVVLTSDGSTVTVNNIADIFQLLEDCI